MRCFLFAPGWNEGGAGHEEQNSGGFVRQAHIYPVRDTAVKQLLLSGKLQNCRRIQPEAL